MEELLKALYSMRVLSHSQIKEYFSEKALNTLISEKCIQKEKMGDESVYMLNAKGVKKAGQYDYFGYDKVYASRLVINPYAFAHQIRLNEFVLNFGREYAGEYRYFDEKFMPRCSNYMMPDGLIETEDTLFLLELDMGKEWTKLLIRKWTNYRGFLRYPHSYYDGKKVVCLFILDGVKNTRYRSVSVFKSIELSISDMISESFDIFVGSPRECYDRIVGAHEKEISEALALLSERDGFRVFDNPMPGVPGYYIHRKDQWGNEQDAIVFDLVSGSALSLKYFTRNVILSAEVTEASSGRNIPLVFLVYDERHLIRIMKTLDIPNPKVYFTTPDRIRKNEYHKALFTAVYLDSVKECQLYSFKDRELREKEPGRLIKF